jgi:hypothetical protein
MNHRYLNFAFGMQASPASFLSFPRAALIVIHKFSCPRNVVIPAWMPVSSAMPVLSVAEGNGNLAALQRLSNTKFHIPVSGFRHPCQNDGVSQTLVYNDERAAWECSTGRVASRIPKTLTVTRGAARPSTQLRTGLDCIPTRRGETRLQ